MKLDRKNILILVVCILLIIAIIGICIFVNQKRNTNNPVENSGDLLTPNDSELNKELYNNLTSGEELKDLDITAVKQDNGSITVDISPSSDLDEEEKEIIVNDKLKKAEFMVTTTNEKPSIDDTNWKEYVSGEKYTLPEANEETKTVYVWYKIGNEITTIADNGIMLIAQGAILMEREEPDVIQNTKTYIYYAIGAKKANRTEYTADKIETITLQNNLNAPSKYINTWDVSLNEDDSVKAWIVSNSADNTMYDLYIGANGMITAPSNSNNLFGHYTNCTSITGLNYLNTGSVTDMSHMFDGCKKLTTIDVSGLNTGNVTDMSNMFNGCNKLITIDVSKWNTENVTDMKGMFQSCNNLTTLDVSKWNTESLMDMSYLFSGCNNIQTLDVSKWQTGKATHMNAMFQSCRNLITIDVSKWQTGNVINMGYMFGNCYNITTIDVSEWNTGNVTDMGYMFGFCQNIKTIDVSKWNTGNVKNMSDMFKHCEKLTTIDVSKWQTGSVTNMSEMFYMCEIKVMMLGNNFNKIISNSFINYGTAIITPRTESMSFGADATTYPAMLYVHTKELERAFESAENAETAFGKGRIKPILELIGENSITIDAGSTYVDAGATVAGFTTVNRTYYEQYGYKLSSSSTVDTSVPGTYRVTYILTKDNEEVMSVERTVIVKQTILAGYIKLSAASGSVPYGTQTATFSVSEHHGGVLTTTATTTGVTTSIANNTITISGIGSFAAGTKIIITVKSGATTAYKEATAQYTLTIDKAKITKPTATDKTYNRTNQVGVPTGTGYSLSGTYQTTNVGGPYTVTATLDSNHKWNDDTTNALTLTWSMRPKDINDEDITKTIGTDAKTYTGSAQTQTVTLKHGTATLSSSTEYTVTYSNNINAGIATIKVTGTGNYTGEISKTFEINRAGIAKPTATDKTYNRANQVGVPTGTGYSLSGTTQTTDVGGPYTVTATLDSNHKWNDDTTNALTLKWSMKPKDINDAEITKTIGTDAKTYTGSAQTQTVILKHGTATLSSSTEYTVTYSNNTNAGTATIKVTGKGNYTGEISKTFTINRQGITIPTVADKTYTGQTQTALTNTTQYKAAGEISGIDVKTYTATVTPTENYQWTDGLTTAKEIKWKIVEKEIEVEWLVKSFVYNEQQQVATVKTPIDGVNGEKVNITVDGAKTNVGTNYPATASISSVTNGQAKKENYKLTNATTTFEITRANTSVAVEITGENKVNKPLTVNATTISNGNKTYQWWWSKDENATEGTPIPDATEISYTPTEDMSGKYVGVTVNVEQTEKYNACSGYSKVLIAVANYKDDASTANYYTTLKDAFKNAKDGSTIKPLRDLVDNEVATVEAGKTYTLDLNGKKITVENISKSFIENKGTLTLDDSTGNGKIEISGDYGIVNIPNGANAVMNVKNGTYLSKNNSPINCYGTTEFNMTGGTLEATNSNGLYFSGAGNITIDNGTVKGTTGLILDYGAKCESLNINGGEILGIKDDGMYIYGDTNLNITNGNITGVGHGIGNYDSNVNIMMTGGKIESQTWEGVLFYGTGTFTLDGGTIKAKTIGLWYNSARDLLIESGTIEGGDLGINISSGCNCKNIIINGGNIIGNTTGIFVREETEINIKITDGEITGKNHNGIETYSSGNIEISNGNITGNNNGIETYSSGKLLVVNGTIKGNNNRGIQSTGTGDIEIKGGNIIGGTNAVIKSKSSSGNITVSGGTLQAGTKATNGDSRGVYMNGLGSVYISGGKIIGYGDGICVVSTGKDLIITGGKIYNKYNPDYKTTGVQYKEGDAIDYSGTGTLSISGKSTEIVAEVQFGVNMKGSGTMILADAKVTSPCNAIRISNASSNSTIISGTYTTTGVSLLEDTNARFVENKFLTDGLIIEKANTVTIGTPLSKDNKVDIQIPTITGAEYGVGSRNGTKTFNFYDGRFKGKVEAINNCEVNPEPYYAVYKNRNGDYEEAYLKKNIVDAKLLEDNIAYTGSEIKPKVEVTWSGEVLVENKDYTVKYENNIKAGNKTGKVIIEGTGEYTGKVEVYFSIINAEITGKVVIKGENTYDEVLTADTSGISPEGCSFTYQWYYNDTNSTEGGTKITGATEKTYRIGEGLVGKYIYVEVEASKENYNNKTFKDITDDENNGSSVVRKANPQLNAKPEGRSEIVKGNIEKVVCSRLGNGKITATVERENILEIKKVDEITFDIKGLGTGETKIAFEVEETDNYYGAKVEIIIVILEENYEVEKADGTIRYENKLKEAVKEPGKVKVLKDVDETDAKIEISKDIELNLQDYTLTLDGNIEVNEGGRLVVIGEDDARLKSKSDIAIKNKSGELVIGKAEEEPEDKPIIEGKKKAIDGEFKFNGGTLVGDDNPPYNEVSGVEIGVKSYDIETKEKDGRYESRLGREKIPPTIEVTQDIYEKTNGNVILTVLVKDIGSGVKGLEYTVNGKTYVLELEKNLRGIITVEENCKFVFSAEDKYGNISRLEYEVTNIDKSAPSVVSARIEGMTEYGVVDNLGVKVEQIKVDADDVTEILISNTPLENVDEQNDWIPYTADMKVPWALLGEGGNGVRNLYFWAKDDVGNISKKIYVLEIEVNTKLIGGNGTNKVTISFAGVDENFEKSELQDEHITYTASGKEVGIGERILEKIASNFMVGIKIGEKYKATLTNIRGAGKLLMNIAKDTLEDKAGNKNIEASIETDIIIDTNAPTLSIESNKLKVTDAEGNLLAVTVNGKTIEEAEGYYGILKAGDKVKAYDKAGNYIIYDVKESDIVA